jgi:ABC-type branched-subunit amino acid transport system ATPase component
MGPSPLLKVSGLYKNFGGVQAIDDLNFEIAEGELLGMIGPNGSGKTTAVNLISGFVKPTEGEIRYRGKNITGWPPYKIVRIGIARTFQMVKPFYQLPAYKNMIIPLYSPRVKKIVGGKYGDRNAVALDLLEEVGFERDSFRPTKLPGFCPRDI